MSGMGSTLIAGGGFAFLFGWLWLAMHLRTRHPQHAARYRPDPVDLPALDDTIGFAPVEGRPPWELAVKTAAELDALQNSWHSPQTAELARTMDPAEEASVRAAHGELVFGTAGGMGCDSGAMAAVRDDAGHEAILRRELALPYGLPGEDGPVAPPSGPAGAGEGEGSGLTAPPAPCSECGESPCWLEEL